MAGPKLDEVTVHRVYRIPGTPRPLALEAQRWSIDRRTVSPQDGMGSASPVRAYTGWKSVAGHLTETVLYPLDGGDFRSAATPWELEWSTLRGAGSGTGFKPVVEPLADGYAMVVAHLGQVKADSLVMNSSDPMALHEPQATFNSRKAMVFVASPSGAVPDAWYWTRGKHDYRTYQVLVAPDGEVLAFLGYSTGINGHAVAVDFSLVDVVLAGGVLLGLGMKLGAKLVSVYARRNASGAVARTLQVGPTRQLSGKAAEKATGLKFEVLSEGPPITGTAVPSSLRIRVGKREFDVSRNADKLDPRGQPIGPATKHLAEDVKRGAWNDIKVDGKGVVTHNTTQSNIWLQQAKVDFPMSSLASGLQVAERAILKGGLATAGRDGVYKVLVEGWEFMIDTTQAPWKVFHAVLR